MKCPICEMDLRGSHFRRHLNASHPDVNLQTAPEVVRELRSLLEKDASDEEIIAWLEN